MKTTILIALVTLTMSFTANANSPGEKPKSTKFISSWVSNHVNYPSKALENKEEGTVYVAFTVRNGKMNELEVVGSVSESLDKEVVETMKSMPMSELGIDINENQTYILPVKFVLK